ncbi:MAG TPA: ABC transporter ATP-binding protein [Bryobacteraceae bacterium]|nr:ABC transporter ATP-binding protein [Bryobacteraceae bacterium]
MKGLLRLIRYASPYSLTLLLSVLLMGIAGAAHALMAILIGPVFDRVLNPKSAEAPVEILRVPGTDIAITLGQLMPDFISNVWTSVAIAIVIVFLLKGLGDYLGNWLVSYAGVSAVTDLRQRVFEKVLNQDATFFEQNPTARIMSSVMNDIDKIQVAVSSMLADWLRQTFVIAGLLYVVLQKDWKLALVSLTVLPIVIVPTLRLGRRIRSATRSAQDHTAELNEILQEAIGGHQVVKAFGGERFELSRFARAAARLKSANLRYVAQQAIASPLIEFFGALTIVGLLTYAREQIKAQQMTTGEFTSFVIALLMLYEPVKRLTGIHNIFQQAMGASQRVFEYLDAPVGVEDKPRAKVLRAFEDSIRFENVGFRYPNSPGSFDFSCNDLEIKRGEVVALVGPSGAGKTTLANLIPRFYDVTSGAVMIDGVDVRNLQLLSLRKNIGIVSQDTFLFNDTVANNIRYAQPEASLDEVKRAARAAMAEDFILRMEDGYGTYIGERGAKLSGGQRQRIAIARALLKNAPILILDEATSHLDTESEALVQGALANLMQGRTVVVIAHRLSTIRRADKIVVLDRGRICEIGLHEDLINQGGIYQRLHELQFVGAVENENS